MIQAIDKKYCIGDLVQLMPYTDSCHLIVNANEIILLKVGSKILVNKYANHPSRNLFPYHEKKAIGNISLNYLNIIKHI